MQFIIYIRGVREVVLLLIILTNNKSKKERKIRRTGGSSGEKDVSSPLLKETPDMCELYSVLKDKSR